MRADRGSAFGRGGNGADGVFFPRTVCLAIRKAAPQVDDRAPADIDAACRPHLTGVPFEVCTEAIGTLAPSFLNMSLHECFACRAHYLVAPFAWMALCCIVVTPCSFLCYNTFSLNIQQMRFQITRTSN